jgi:hypothetical protein
MDILKKYNKMVDAKKKEGYKEEYLRLTDTMENTQMYKDALRRTSAQTPQTRTAPRATQAFFYADNQLIGTMNIEED